MKDEHLYLQARSEVDSSRRNPAIWAKAMSVTNNDEIVSRYAYIALRMEQLVEHEQIRNSSPSQTNPMADEEHPLADLDGTLHTAKPDLAPAAIDQDQEYKAWESNTGQEHERQQAQHKQQPPAQQQAEPLDQPQQQTQISDAVVLADDPTLMALPEFSRISGMTDEQARTRAQTQQHALVATNGGHFVKRDAVTPLMQNRTFANGELADRAFKGGKGWLKAFAFIKLIAILAIAALAVFFPELVTKAVEWIKNTIPALSGLMGQ